MDINTYVHFDAERRYDGAVQRSQAFDLASPVPLYHQIAAVLRERIADGTYTPDAVIPSEAQLCDEFGVSRATIRQAVGELVEARLVMRGRGRGTRVLPGASEMLGQQFRGSLADLLAETRRAQAASVEVERDAELSPRIASLLALEVPSGTVVRRRRTMNDAPFAYTLNYLPPDLGRLLTRKDLQKDSLLWLLIQRGVAVAHATQSIRARACEPGVAEQLGVAPASPVLYVERLVVTKQAKPVELVQSWYRGDAYEYTVSLELDDSERHELYSALA
jgi:GntR family transcriptional regulator